MDATPTVSVLIPVRDGAVTLDACLRSLARQTLPDWECVLVDDGSRDGSLEVARRRFADDPRLRTVARGARGIVAALGTGLALCRGRYVARMDADDLMHRDRLRAQAAALDADPTLAGVGSHVRLFPRRRLGDGYRAYERWLNGIGDAGQLAREAWIECPLAHPTLMIRREVIRTLGWRDRGWPEDYDLVLRALGAGLRLGVVPRRLLAWRDGPERLSRRSATYAVDRFTACKASFLAETFLAGHERYVLWGHGGTGRALRRALATHGRHPSHIVELHPGRIGNRIHGADVVSPDELEHLPRRPLVASVAGHEARTLIRRRLAALGDVELRDFVCAA